MFNSILNQLVYFFDSPTFHLILNKISYFFEVYLYITATVFIIVGLILMFYGLIISQIIIWFIGFFWGGILGAGIGYSLAINYNVNGNLGALFGFIVLGVIIGSIFLAIINLIPKIIGFVIAYSSMFFWIKPEGWWHIIPAIVGFIGGWLGGFLHRAFLITTSALAGACMVTISSLKLYAHYDKNFFVNANVYDTFLHYIYAGILLCFSLTIVGIIKQYKLLSVYSGLFGNKSSKDTVSTPQEEQCDKNNDKTIRQIEKLKKLKEKGAITEEEFNSKIQKL